MSKINFCSAPCGSGKTYQIVDRASQLAAKGEYVLVLQPTKELIDKTIQHELLTRSKPSAFLKFYTDDNCSKSVGGRLAGHFNCPVDQGHIVFATHQVLPFVPFWANKSQWHVFVDEELQVVKHNCRNLPDTHRLITDYLDLEPHDAIYSRLIVTDREALSAIARNKNEDDVYERFSEPAELLINENWVSFVNTEQFARLKAAQAKQLSIHSILSPKVLAGSGSVTMASANFPDTLIYRLWGNMGVEFAEDARLSQGLQFQEHSNGHLITIKYATELPWSKSLQNRKAQPDNEETDDSILDEVIEAAKAECQDRPFLWQANKSLPGNPFGSNAQRLPNLPHGLNDYSNFDRICFLSALNPAPDHYRFLASRGLSNEEVQRAIYCSAVYQSVMRTSIRDPHNENPKTIIVPDRIAAKYLTELFPGSRIEKLPTKISEQIITSPRGRPKIHKSNRDKNAAHRSRKRLQQLENVVKNAGVRPYSLRNVVDESKKTCDENTIDIEGSFVTTFSKETYGTIYESKYAQDPLCYLNRDDLDGFVDFLKLFHEYNVCSRKDNNWLMSPAIFDPKADAETKRGLGNIVTIRNLWLDFENGELQPEEFADLFPTTKLLIFNSYRHTNENPRFRVVFPFEESVTADEYVILYDQAVAKIEDAGYWVKNCKGELPPSGLDTGKRTPSSLFYLPCQAKNPADSFFLDYYHDNTRDVLDPKMWITNNVVPFPKEPRRGLLAQPTTVDQGKVAAATELWRQSVNYPGEGYARFWQFAVDLRSAGMNPEQIKATLEAEVAYGRSPKKRQGQIRWIMKSLRQSCKAA